MTGEWDAIVVGGGLGGLTAAAYLAAAGQRVLVLEQHDWAGGNSHVFRRRRAYEFDVGVHYLGDCGPDGIIPAILGGLGARERVEFRSLDPDCFDVIDLPGITVRVPASWPEYRNRLVRALPHDTIGLHTFVEICRAVGQEQRDALLSAGVSTPMEVLARTPTVRQWGRRSLSELFDYCGLSTAARSVLAAQSPNYGMAPSQATVSTHAVVTDHYLRGAYFPVGGGQMLAATLVEVIEAHDGELRTRATVTGIEITDGQVRGVRTADGTMFTASVVISNADYRRTILELAGAEHFSSTVVRNTRSATMGLPFATAYVALDRPLPDRGEANVWWYDSDDLEAMYARLLDGRQQNDIGFLFISFGSLKDPSMCPPGHTNFQLMTLCPPGYEHWGVSLGPADGGRYRRDPAYLAEKRRFTKAMLTAGERVLGPFRDHVVHAELATPLTQERYTRSSGGTPFGLATWGPSGMRPDTATGVRGLYVTGQSTRYGSGITGVMVSGIACAGKILDRPLLSEVHRGIVLGEGGSLPERDSAWDPLAVSRGRARANARGLAKLN
jgi:all-trans-retinol 13,14-reductase